ncbi:MAG: Hpt domain-containing protein [Acidobacteria bacterium]|nr:Hpt domain-containing protein [Acidobacteriota bacterium]
MMKFSNELAKLDCAVALERLGGDEELLREVARLFLDEYPMLMNEIRSAAVERDASAMERAAHSMKGSVSNFGTERVYDAAYALERMGRAGDLSTADEFIAKLESALAYIHPALVELAEN